MSRGDGMKQSYFVQTALFAAAAIALSALERLVPLDAFFPIPGLRLGLANLAVMAAYVRLGKRSALCVGVLKVLSVFVTFGNLTALVLSAAGTALAFLALLLCGKLADRFCTYIGVSALCAVCHAAGQLGAASALSGSSAVWYLFPLLAAASGVTGALTGLVMNLTARVLTKEQT